MCPRILLVLLTLLLFVQNPFSGISVRVFSRDEALYENNISKPRLYIENIGTVPISNFYCYYYFTKETNKTPVLEDYYTPSSSVSMTGTGNEYRVKYDFAGKTLQPGQIIPSTEGNCIGIRYSDWSNIDKTNDRSCNMSTVMTLNGNISVYLSDGTQIYGNGLPDPQNPPLPPPVDNSMLANFTIYSSQFTDIRDRAHISGGNVGSAVYTESGCDAVIGGGIYSGGNLSLRERDTVKGDAIASEFIIKQNGVVISGTERAHAQIKFPQLSIKSVTYGTSNITVNNDATCELDPGNYQDFHAFSRSVVRINPGKYTFKTFIVEPDVKIILKISQGQDIEFSVSEQLSYADRDTISFESGTVSPFSFRIYSTQTSLLSTGTESVIYGLYTAPSAEIHVYSRTDLYGALYGKRVIVEPEAFVCKPPVLTDLWHSEWAMAPSFNPLVFNYTTIVPDATATIFIKPFTSSGNTVTVNSLNSDNPVNLNSSENNISILLESPASCGATEYKLSISKSPAYMIYVNDDSPCPQGYEDGNSWNTAFKNLQQAIDAASVAGKEIWVAEGVYKPTKRTVSSDPRSATFLIPPGIEIKGSYDGTETEDDPQGSTYNTVLSGDLAGNDDSLSFWPPLDTSSSFISDNVYHVITINQGNTKGIHLFGLSVKGGVANGTGDNSKGAGIIHISSTQLPAICDTTNMVNSLTLDFCVIKNNYSLQSGAGIFSMNAPVIFNHCLFEGNYTVKGNGAGLYAEGNCLEIDGCVFSKNTTKLTDISIVNGGAIFLEKSNVKTVNTIFYENSAKSAAGAIYCSNSTLDITNCSFVKNSSAGSCAGIKNVNSTSSIINSILWDEIPDTTVTELSGTGFDVSYSCVKNSFTGSGNINTDPLFVDADNAAGDDTTWGTVDDGLKLLPASPVIGASSDSFPELDIILTYRIVNDSGKSDLGAYAFIPQSADFQNSEAVFGYFNENNEFTIPATIKAYQLFDSEWGYILARNSLHVLYARLLVENNKHTRDITSGPVTLYSKDFSNNDVFSKKITMQRAAGEMISGKLVFYSKYPIMFLQHAADVAVLSETKSDDDIYFTFGNADSVKSFVITAYTKDYR